MTPRAITRLILGAILLFVIITTVATGTYVVDPGYRGVLVTLGKVSEVPKPEGFGTKLPLVSMIIPVTIRQQTGGFEADCYSSDLQQVKIALRVLYRIPEGKVVTLYRDYHGDPFVTLVQPRVAEAVKELTALRTAEVIVQKREDIKTGALALAREKLGELLIVEDIVLEDISLTQVLERAIEAKMVQEQEAARARFAQQQAQVEASTAVIKAKGEAESISLRGKALAENPSVLDLQVVESWDGAPPLVVGPTIHGANMILPLSSQAPQREVAR